jgi:hypothetical protein
MNCEVNNVTIEVHGEEDVPQSLISFEGLMSNSSRCGIITVNGDVLCSNLILQNNKNNQNAKEANPCFDSQEKYEFECV